MDRSSSSAVLPNRAGVGSGFGAVLVGYHDGDGSFHYAGKVGTGFNDDALRELRVRMDELEVKDSPFAGGHRFERGTPSCDRS